MTGDARPQKNGLLGSLPKNGLPELGRWALIGSGVNIAAFVTQNALLPRGLDRRIMRMRPTSPHEGKLFCSETLDFPNELPANRSETNRRSNM